MKERHELVPHGWEVVKVGDLARYINGLPFKPSDWETQGRPIIRIQNLTGSNKSFNYTTKKVDDNFIVRPGDILVSWSATLDAFIWTGPEAVLNQHIFKVDPFENWIDPAFIFWGLKEVIQEMWLSEHTHGSTMKHINRGPFLAHDFLLPPLPEQRRIAEKINGLMGRLDACRKRLEQVPRLLKQFRQSVLEGAYLGDLTAEWRNSQTSLESADVFLRKMGVQAERLGADSQGSRAPVPKSWSVVRFGSVVASIRGGSTAVPTDNPTSFPILRSSSVRHGSVGLADVRYLSGEDSDNKLNYLAEGDLLFTRLSGSLEYVANCALVRNLEGRRIQYPDRLFCAKLMLPMNASYFEIIFGAPRVRKQITDRAKSSAGHQRISISDIKAQLIPVPSLAEQKEIVRRVEDLFTMANAVEDHYRKAQEQLDKLPRSILAKAFRGELVPQDPADEPASTLIERIRSGRLMQPAHGRPQERRAAKGRALRVGVGPKRS